MNFRTMPRPDLEITWYRQSGVFNFTNSDGEPVTGVSAQTWEDYLNHVEDLPSKTSSPPKRAQKAPYSLSISFRILASMTMQSSPA